MGKSTLAQAETLAHKILVRYFCDSDIEFMISTFAEEIIWLGGGEKQKAEGRKAVEAHFRSGAGSMISCDMSEEETVSMDLGNGCYLCECVSRLRSRPESGAYLNVIQRATFLFREKGDGLETLHIHNSVPYTEIKGEELFPIESSRAEFLKLQKALTEKNQEFERQAQFLEQLYNTIPCGIIQFSTDPGHKMISINPMVWKLFGFESEEAYCEQIENALQLVNEEDRDGVENLIGQLVLNGAAESYHRPYRKKNGETIWLNVVMGRIVNNNGLEVIQAVYSDITRQIGLEKAQEQERLVENRSLRAAICTVYPLIVSVNLTEDTYSCFVNDQTTFLFPGEGRFSDLMRDSVGGAYLSYREDIAAVFNREEILRRFRSGEREIYTELREMGSDGAYHWVSVHIVYVENPVNDDILAIDLIKVLDTQRMEQARQEQLLRDALASAKAASRAKSDFLSRMSHDIRTPMNAVIGMSTIGQLKLDDQKVVRDCFQKIDASSQFLLSLINDILDMSKIETQKMDIAHDLFEFSSFVDEVNQIIYPQTADRDISYEMRHEEPLESHYIGDALRLKQILMNLLSNALKFTPAGGQICVDIKERKRAGGYAYVQFVVRDTGVGMSEEFLEKLFQPFEQEAPGNARNNVGSGLGLSIVYNLVQLMGGAIQVDSKKGRGSSFNVAVPLQIVSDDKEKEWERKRRGLLKGFQVLVADDDPAVGRQAAGILEDIGARTVFAQSGLTAVEEVKRSLEKNRPFDIAMIDWKMPDIDGIETARRIRRLAGPGTMLIMITAYAWGTIEREAREAGIDYFISKPLFRSVLYNTFAKLEHKEPLGIPHQEKAVRAAALEGMRLLLAEDNALNQEIAKTLLEMHGAAVDVADNGSKAVECFAQREPGTYQAILMDIRMPVMDGLEATKRIRALPRRDAAEIPILAMTANAFEEDKKIAYSASMNGYLVKPLDINVLIGELEKLR